MENELTQEQKEFVEAVQELAAARKNYLRDRSKTNLRLFRYCESQANRLLKQMGYDGRFQTEVNDINY